MSRLRRFPTTLVALLGLLLALIAGLSWLFSRRLSAGDVYPEYSSLRADPKGIRAWYEALETLPGIRVERDLRDLQKLPADPPRTLLLVGVPSASWAHWPAKDVKAINAAARAGSRVVVIFAPENGVEAERLEKEQRQRDEQIERNKDARKRAEKRSTTSKSKPAKSSPDKNADAPSPDAAEAKPEAEKTETKPDAPKDSTTGTKPEKTIELFDLEKEWGYATDTRVFDRRLEANREVRREPGTPAILPERMPWLSDLYFEAKLLADWRIVYRRQGSPVVIERAWGKGTLVLVADAASVSNEFLQKSPQPGWLAWLTGPSREIIFCEQIHGLALEPGIASLARRYGLAGAFFVLLLAAALFVWQRATLFVPPDREADEQRLMYEQTAGLEALLRRTVPPGKILAACRDEHARHARAGEVRRLSEFFKDADAASKPVATYNQIVRALKRRATSLF